MIWCLDTQTFTFSQSIIMSRLDQIGIEFLRIIILFLQKKLSYPYKNYIIKQGLLAKIMTTAL